MIKAFPSFVRMVIWQLSASIESLVLYTSSIKHWISLGDELSASLVRQPRS